MHTAATAVTSTAHGQPHNPEHSTVLCYTQLLATVLLLQTHCSHSLHNKHCSTSLHNKHYSTAPKHPQKSAAIYPNHTASMHSLHSITPHSNLRTALNHSPLNLCQTSHWTQLQQTAVNTEFNCCHTQSQNYILLLPSSPYCHCSQHYCNLQLP